MVLSWASTSLTRTSNRECHCQWTKLVSQSRSSTPVFRFPIKPCSTSSSLSQSVLLEHAIKRHDGLGPSPPTERESRCTRLSLWSWPGRTTFEKCFYRPTSAIRRTDSSDSDLLDLLAALWAHSNLSVRLDSELKVRGTRHGR